MISPHFPLFRAGLIAAVLGWSGQASGEVGDVTLRTDHPQYPGEGAFQTPESCSEFATAGLVEDQQRALAMFNWLLTHQWHLASPQEWNVPGLTPGAEPDNPEMMVADANRARFSYGYGLCGTVHAWNEVYWRALGLAARRRAFPGHTNSEVLIGGRWRMLDTDMAGVVFNRDGSLAGYDEITRDLALLDEPHPPWPRYPFAWPGDFQTMHQGWEEVAAGGHWYAMYHGGYAAQPAVTHLRSGETFTRYIHPDAFGGPTRRRFWHRQPEGPSRLWTFANQGTPAHDGPRSNCRGAATYGNALFEYAPRLNDETFRQGVVQVSENVQPTAAGLSSSDEQAAFVIFEHFSPYVICGDPLDNEDPLQHAATDGLVVRGRSSGAVQLGFSSDQGQTWTQMVDLDGPFRVDLTEAAKGRYGWWLKFSWSGPSVLADLSTATTGQMSQAIYPRLTPGGCRVIYRAGSRSVAPVLPRLEDEQATVDRFEDRPRRSQNLEFIGRRAGQRMAYVVQGPKPASLVFRVDTPSALVGLSAAARFSVRSPTPPGTNFSLEWSANEGQTWRPLADVVPPVDNEYSSGWVDGTAAISEPDVRRVLVRIGLNGGGAATGLITAELYGLRQTSAPSRATVTYSWWEGARRREHAFVVPAGQLSAVGEVPTGDDVRDDFVRIAVD